MQVVKEARRSRILSGEDLLEMIRQHPRYERNLDWGVPRPGHWEGTIRAHIAEVEENLSTIAHLVPGELRDRLRILTHVHDLFKAEAAEGVPLRHPRSHASLAKKFLTEFTFDRDLLFTVQYHDEPYALWCQFAHRGDYNRLRMKSLLNGVDDWDLMVFFVAIDGLTPSKCRAPVDWFIEIVKSRRGVSKSWLEAVEAIAGARGLR